MAIPSSDTKITPFRNDRPAEGGRDAPLRALPHNIEAEQGLLGSLLRNNRAYEKVANFYGQIILPTLFMAESTRPWAGLLIVGRSQTL